MKIIVAVTLEIDDVLDRTDVLDAVADLDYSFMLDGKVLETEIVKVFDEEDNLLF